MCFLYFKFKMKPNTKSPPQLLVESICLKLKCFIFHAFLALSWKLFAAVVSAASLLPEAPKLTSLRTRVLWPISNK